MCETTKPCTRCCEPIPLGASRCPRCQSWQSLRAYILVGAKSETDRDMVLLPGAEQAFQVTSNADAARDLYASHKVYIRDARDARRWP